MAINEKIVLEAEDRASKALRTAGGNVDNLGDRTEKASKAADRARGGYEKFGKVLKGALFAGGAAIAIGKLAQLAGASVQTAVDAEEAASAFETTFGEAVGGASSFVDEFAIKAGFASHELQQMLAITGNVVQGLGATEQGSADLAQEMAILAGDVASFSNAQGGAEAVMAALQSAINGEREALKTYGLAVSEAEVQQAAFNATGKTSADDLTRLEKAYATVEIATEKAGKAVGDLDRTQDSAANRQRQLSARWTEAQRTLGEGLLPAWETMLELGIQLAPVVSDLATQFASMTSAAGDFEVPEWVRSIPQGLGLMADVGGGAVGVLTNMAEAGVNIGKIFQGDPVGGWKGFVKAVQEGGGAIEDAVDNAQIRTGLESLVQDLASGEDAGLALANSLAFLDRQGELTGDTIQRFGKMADLGDLELLNVLRFMRDQTDVPIRNMGALTEQITELERTAFMRGGMSSADRAMMNSSENAVALAGSLSEVETEATGVQKAVGRMEGALDAGQRMADTLATKLSEAAAAGESVNEVLNQSSDPVFQAVDAWQGYQEALKEATDDGVITAQEELDLLRQKMDLQAALEAAGGDWDQAMQAMSMATGKPVSEIEALLDELGMLDGQTFRAAVEVSHETHYTETGPRPVGRGGDQAAMAFATGTWSTPGNPSDEIPATLHGTEIVIPPEGTGGRADFARQLAAELGRVIGTSGSGGVSIGQLIVHARTAADGEAIADTIEARVTDLAIQGMD